MRSTAASRSGSAQEMIRTLRAESVPSFLLQQHGEVTLIDAGLSGHRDTLKPSPSVCDRRLRTRQA
jgi:protein-disulfide isomerase-like protein with CxxC motif